MSYFAQKVGSGAMLLLKEVCLSTDVLAPGRMLNLPSRGATDDLCYEACSCLENNFAGTHAPLRFECDHLSHMVHDYSLLSSLTGRANFGHWYFSNEYILYLHVESLKVILVDRSGRFKPTSDIFYEMYNILLNILIVRLRHFAAFHVWPWAISASVICPMPETLPSVFWWSTTDTLIERWWGLFLA